MELEEGLQENAVQLYKIFEQKGGAVRRSDLMNKGLRLFKRATICRKLVKVRRSDLMNKGLRLHSIVVIVGVINVRRSDLMNKGLRRYSFHLSIQFLLVRRSDLMNKGLRPYNGIIMTGDIISSEIRLDE